MSIEVGRALADLLTKDEVLSAKVDDRVFPIISHKDIAYPYIAYRRKDMKPAYTKDRDKVEDSLFVDIVVVAERYAESIEIAKDVLRILERKKGVYRGIDISDIRLSDSEEDADEVYIQRLEFEVMINVT